MLTESDVGICQPPSAEILIARRLKKLIRQQKRHWQLKITDKKLTI